MKIHFATDEVLILLATSVMSFLANLPGSFLGNMVDRKILLVALIILVVVAMFRYLQMLLLLTISILAIGANLPAEIALSLGISKFTLLVSLSILVTITLVNRIVNLLPPNIDNSTQVIHDGREHLMAAIASGDHDILQRMLITNPNVNFTLNGTTPLHLAAEKSYPEIVKLLISHGADFQMKNADGKTPLDIALEKTKFIHSENK